MQTDTIQRESAVKAKGLRLQKLRALRLTLEMMSKRGGQELQIYSAIEDRGDVSVTQASTDGAESYIEEDKNYDPDVNFTLFSTEIRNTLVIFFDILFEKWRGDSSLRFGFYATAGIGKEQGKKLASYSSSDFSKTKILESLQANNLSDDVVLLVKAVLEEEYESQYKAHQGKGNLDLLKAMTSDEFRSFLSRISWFFGQDDDKKVETEVHALIRASNFTNIKNDGKQELICSLLMELLDQKLCKPSYALRFLHSSEVELIFKKAESEIVAGKLDPAWAQNDELASTIKDKRNLREKIRSSCANYPEKKIAVLERKTCRAKAETGHGNKSYLSLRYRVYEACQDYLSNLEENIKLSPLQIDALLEKLTDAALAELEYLTADFSYPLSNRISIHGVILDLFDSCYLSLDEVGSNEG